MGLAHPGEGWCVVAGGIYCRAMWARMTIHFRAGLLCVLSVVLPTSSGLTARAAESSPSPEAKPTEHTPSNRNDRDRDESKERETIGRADACAPRDRPRMERRESGESTGSGQGAWTGIAGSGADWGFDQGVSTIEGALIVVGGNVSDPRVGVWAVGPPHRPDHLG